MARTPEAAVKEKVTALLNSYAGIWYYMPVPTGYGKRTVDYLGCFRGVFFAIETKAEGKQPTPLQFQTIEDIEGAYGTVFIVAGETPDDLLDLYEWLEAVNERVPYVRQPPAPSQVRGRPI